MKVLIINVNAYTGSTGRITYGLYKYLKSNGHEVKVCYRGMKEEPIANIDFIPLVSKLEFRPSVMMARITGLESHFSFFATKKLMSVFKDFKPDIVQLYNIHGNYIRSYSFLEYLESIEVPVVYSMLDEFAYMGKCPYPEECEKFKKSCESCPQKKNYPESWFFDTSNLLFRKKNRIYSGFKNLIFTGPPFVCKRAKESYLLHKCDVRELYEPFNFDDYYYPKPVEDLRKKLGISEEDRVALCASGTAPRKRGKDFMQIARLLNKEPNMKFIFIGYNRSDWDIPDNVEVLGFIKDQNELADYMSLADVYVCTSVGDTTPSVCLGALGCGTPLIGYDYGGIIDCAPNEYGTYVPIGDVCAMADAVKKIKKKSKDDVSNIREYALKQFSAEQIYKKQCEIYNEMINR